MKKLAYQIETAAVVMIITAIITMFFAMTAFFVAMAATAPAVATTIAIIGVGATAVLTLAFIIRYIVEKIIDPIYI